MSFTAESTVLVPQEWWFVAFRNSPCKENLKPALRGITLAMDISVLKE
jgi:hypothetical protein